MKTCNENLRTFCPLPESSNQLGQERYNVKFHAIIIQPTAAFGTPLKGDTIFGHFCWQAAENEVLSGGLEQWIDRYLDTPFAVFSSAFPRIVKNGNFFYALPRPSLPTTNSAGRNSNERYRQMKTRKKEKKNKYLLVGDDLQPVFTPDRYYSDEDLFQFQLESLPAEQQKGLRLLSGKQRRLSGGFEQAHNTINRLTMTTGAGRFAPFTSENIHYLPGVRLAVFALFNEEATDIDRIKAAFVNMGEWGFGRDASAGLGRFQVVDVREMEMPQDKKSSCYTLAPCVPEKNSYKNSYFTPFVRFGKHGAALLHKRKPFKNPVVMADEGAIFTPKSPEIFKKPYIGSAVTNLSKADKRTVMQGYAIYLPCDIEERI